jgi:hypothetical protein
VLGSVIRGKRRLQEIGDDGSPDDSGLDDSSLDDSSLEDSSLEDNNPDDDYQDGPVNSQQLEAPAMPISGYGTRTTTTPQVGGWLKGNKIVGAGLFVGYEVYEKEDCDDDDDYFLRNNVRLNDDGHPELGSLRTLCRGDKKVEFPIKYNENRYDTDYFKSIQSHVELIDMGEWGIGLQQMYCILDVSKKYWLNDVYNPYFIRKMFMYIPLSIEYNKQYALMKVQWLFHDDGNVEYEHTAVTYDIDKQFSWEHNKARLILEFICLLLGIELLFRAVSEIKHSGVHFSSLLTIVSSIVFVLSAIIWLAIAYVTVEVVDVTRSSPLTPDGYEPAVNLVTSMILLDQLTNLYSYIQTIFGVLALFRCFNILSFHKRLSMMTETLWEGFVDMYHWSLVIIILTLVFSTLFHLIFGSSNEKFSTIGGSAENLLLMVIGLSGAMESNENLTGVAWALVMLYGATISILMVNLSLGIVLDAYNVHTREREESDTIPYSLMVYFYRIGAKKVKMMKGLFKRDAKVTVVRDGADSNVRQFRRGSEQMNFRQLHAMPISIRAASDVLRAENLSETMIKNILKNIIVSKLCEGQLETRVKKNVIAQSNAKKKKKKVD